MFNAPITASWVVKKLYTVKEKLSRWMGKPQYSIAEVYKELMSTAGKVAWSRFVWIRAAIPRSCFVAWLAYHERLKTKQRLLSTGVVDNDLCPTCGTELETTKHLFFRCKFSHQCPGISTT